MPGEALTERPQVRVALEFIVIVASILVAFGLDAWWDSRVERAQVLDRLQALETELVGTRQYISYQRERLEEVRVVVGHVLGHVSPDAPLLTPDSLNRLIERSFAIGSIELQERAPQTMQSVGDMAALGNADLTRLLASWPMAVAEVRTSAGLLEDNRELILAHLYGSYPTLDIAQKTGEMGRYPSSSFEASTAVVQRDRTVEGLFGHRGMMVEDTDTRLGRLDVVAAELLAVIRASR